MAVWSITKKNEIVHHKRFDGEFFHPKYLNSEQKVIKTNTVKRLGQIGNFIIGPFGSSFHVSNYDPLSKYRYIRGKDVKPFALLDNDNVYMPEKDYRRLVKYAVIPGDLIISVVGTLGNVAIVPKNVKGIFSCKSTIFRNSIVNPYYLLAYLNCKYGQDCLLRRQRGAIQTGLNKGDLKTVPVPVFPFEEETIGDLIHNSLELFGESKKLYMYAQQLLEKELGLDKMVLKRQKSNETTFSEIMEHHRVDAEYFHIKYESILEAIKKYNGGIKPLYQLSSIINPNFKPGEATGSIDYIEIGDINITDGEYSPNNMPAKELPANAKIRLNGSELIISRVRPTRGAIALIDEKLKVLTVCSGAFYTCVINDTEQKEIIFLYFRVIKEIFEKYCKGTSYPTIDKTYISRFPVPAFASSISKKIKHLIGKSKHAKKESERLLEQAKQRVEELIEGGG